VELKPADQRRRFYVETFGCQMNVNDSEKVAGLLIAAGHQPVADAESADFVFVNTCAVREKAQEKLYHFLGRLRKLKKRRPGLKIGVGGCVAQLQGEELLARAPEVDLLVGPRRFARVPELLGAPGEGVRIDLDRKGHSLDVPADYVAHGSKVRAYVTAMEGCNRVCSFCVVPRTRGPETCRSPEAIEEEVRSLVAKGYQEVTLLGQTVNAFRSGGTDFVDLLRRVDAVRGLTRLRFTTSHPARVGTRLAEAFATLPSLCPYLHLPVQSGSDRILSDMRRGYTVGEYLAVIDLLRSHCPDLALSSDVIVGYPGETEADFSATLELVERIGFSSLFAFTYSPRPGTLAARRCDDVPAEEKRRRLSELSRRQQAAQLERNTRKVGARLEVLVDAADESAGRVAGRTPQFQIVHLDGGPELLGRLVWAEVTGGGPNALVGRLEAVH
jgi:tRNA-2-methylthio-N6-dimethylallyladenosine synthase